MFEIIKFKTELVFINVWNCVRHRLGRKIMNMNSLTLFDISDIKSMQYDDIAPLFDGKNVVVKLNDSSSKKGIAKVVSFIFNLLKDRQNF